MNQTLQTRAARRAGPVAPAFTLVELLAVVFIIALLIAILVPSLSAVRNNAKKVATSSTIASLTTGLEAFRNDFDGYVPSQSDQPVGSFNLRVKNPYDGVPGFTGTTQGQYIQEMPGAGLLVWGMVGADQLGTPGFKIFRKGSSQYWSEDTDAKPINASNPVPSNSGAYAISNQGRPVQPRSGPSAYIDIEKVKITPPRLNGNQTQGWYSPREDSIGGRASNFAYPFPMFVDAWGSPILYYRANPAGETFVWNTELGNTGSIGGIATTGIYDYADNAPLFEDNDLRIRTTDSGSDHLMKWANGYTVNPANTPGNSQEPPANSFQRYIWNQDIRAKFAPQNPETFVLISPGADGQYGTADDVTNFKPNPGQG